MYINMVFIGYMTAVFSGLINIITLIFLKFTKNIRDTFGYRRFGLFSMFSFLFVLLYFIFYYRESVCGIYNLKLPWRLMDYTFGCGLLFSWINYVNGTGLKKDWSAAGRKNVFVAGIVSVFWMCIGFYMSIAHMNPYYYIADTYTAIAFSRIETVLTALMIILIIKSYLNKLREQPPFLLKIYLFVVSIVLIFFSIVQVDVNCNLYRGNFGISAWAMEIVDPTGVAFIIINITSVIFILKANLFFSPEADLVKGDLEIMLGAVSEKYNLTDREEEILGLVYQGYSNPDIARMLYISSNTVKAHMRNIYHKLPISSRVDAFTDPF